MKTMLKLALVAAAAVAAFGAHAQDFPAKDKTVTIVVPFAAGGETDLVARMLADGMSKELKQVMVVQNIVGASGVAGISAVTGAKPGKMFIVTLPFFIISCVALVMLSLFPSLSLGLLK